MYLQRHLGSFNIEGSWKDSVQEIVKAWLETPFEGGRYERRLKKIEDIENKIYQKGCQSFSCKFVQSFITIAKSISVSLVI